MTSKLALLPGVTAAHVALGEARHRILDAATKVGHKRVDRETPLRLLRAYWVPRWSGNLAELTPEMIDDSVAFLERVAVEMYARLGPPPESGEYRLAGEAD